jgi:hypothetical protein
LTRNLIPYLHIIIDGADEDGVGVLDLFRHRVPEILNRKTVEKLVYLSYLVGGRQDDLIGLIFARVGRLLSLGSILKNTKIATILGYFFPR